jgi:hypothetical protein
MSDQDVIHSPDQPEPKELNEEAENLIAFVYANELIVVEFGYTGFGLEAVLLGRVLKSQTVGTYLRKRRELWPLQQRHQVGSS